jgi:hypothetical protein
MLDVDEQVAAVGRGRQPGYLAAFRAGEETPDLAADHVGHQHLVVAESLMIATTEDAAGRIGLNPQAAITIEPQSVRTAEGIAPDVAPLRRVGMLRVAAKNENVPGEMRRRLRHRSPRRHRPPRASG